MRRDSTPIRVLLGSPALDVWRVRHVTPAFRRWWALPPDQHMASIVESEVLAVGGHALLLAGGGHVLRGIYADRGIVNCATRLNEAHPGSLYGIETTAVTPQEGSNPTWGRLEEAVEKWPRPALATLKGTWLGSVASPFAERAVSQEFKPFEAQADAILHLGTGGQLTASQADPTLFETGRYRAQLARLNPLVSRIDHTRENLITQSLRWAEAPPNWFDQFGS